jgi:hypothetical protein
MDIYLLNESVGASRSSLLRPQDIRHASAEEESCNVRFSLIGISKETGGNRSRVCDLDLGS